MATGCLELRGDPVICIYSIYIYIDLYVFFFT